MAWNPYLKAADGPFGMTAAELKEADNIIRATTETALEGIKALILAACPTADFDGTRVSGACINMKIKAADDPSLPRLLEMCKDWEENASYPELHFKISPQRLAA